MFFMCSFLPFQVCLIVSTSFSLLHHRCLDLFVKFFSFFPENIIIFFLPFPFPSNIYSNHLLYLFFPTAFNLWLMLFCLHPLDFLGSNSGIIPESLKEIKKIMLQKD